MGSANPAFISVEKIHRKGFLLLIFFSAFLLQQIVINLFNSDLPAGLIVDVEIFPERVIGR